MPTYSIELTDHDGTGLGELADAQLTQVTWANSDIGSIDFTMPQVSDRVADPILRRHEVKVFIEDWPDDLAVPWQGPILNDTQDDKNVQFSGQSLEWYLAKRYIDFSSLDYSDLVDGYEQTLIGWGLVQYAQGIPVQNVTINNPDKDLRFTVGGALPVTTKRLRKYNREDHANILELLKEFPSLVDYVTGAPNGFDWAIMPMRDGRRVWTPFAPQRGTFRPELTLEYGRNIVSYRVTETMVNFAARGICTGGSNGDVKMENEWKDAAASAEFGEDLGIISDGSEMDPTELGSKARQYVQARNHPIVSPDLSAVRVPVDLLGVLMPGDTVPISIHNGRTDIEDVFRIATVKWAVRPDVLQLTFVPPAGNS